MVWKPGESGNPTGIRKSKPITDALRLELMEPADFKVHRRSARGLARAILNKAGAGDAMAWREVADRLEGKVPQAIGQSDELSPLQLVITGVPRPEPITVEHQPVALEQKTRPPDPSKPDTPEPNASDRTVG